MNRVINYSLVVSLSVLPIFALGCSSNTGGQGSTEQAQRECGGDCNGGGNDMSDAGEGEDGGNGGEEDGGNGGSCKRFSGHAEALRARGTLLYANISEVTLPPIGGQFEKHVAEVDLLPLLYADLLKAQVKGFGDTSYAESDVLRLRLGPPGIGVELDVLKAESFAKCDGGRPVVWGESSLIGLKIDGHEVEVLNQPNQVIDVPGIAHIVLNEQTSNVNGTYGRITTNGLHVTLFGTEDFIVSGTEADIDCGCEVPVY